MQLLPLNTAPMVAMSSDPDFEAVPMDASDEEHALFFAKALARRAVLAWEGIGDADGNPVTMTAENTKALFAAAM